MIDANRGATEETLRRLQEESYERFRTELFKSVEQLLTDFEMTWDDLAEKLKWPWLSRSRYMTGAEIKQHLGIKPLTTFTLNEIAAVFSAEPYVIFKPRLPWTGN